MRRGEGERAFLAEGTACAKAQKQEDRETTRVAGAQSAREETGRVRSLMVQPSKNFVLSQGQ